MADSAPYSDTNDDRGSGPARGSTSGTPRWVKVFAVIVGVLVLALVLMALLGGGLGEHGPWRHTPGGEISEGEGSPSGRPESGGHTPPPGMEHRPPRP